MPTVPYDDSAAALLTPALRPTVFATGQGPNDLWLACEMARLAYVRVEDGGEHPQRLASDIAKVGFTGLRHFHDAPTDTEAFAAMRAQDGLAVVAFRGTESTRLRDVKTDLKAQPSAWYLTNDQAGPGCVHSGFLGCANALHGALQEWLDHTAKQRSRLLVTGHSLGAALATLAAARWPEAELITLGSPRVGDRAFAAAYAARRWRRIVDNHDLVTTVPPEGLLDYTHVGALVHINREGVVDSAAPGVPEAAVGAADHPGFFDNLRDFLPSAHAVLPRALTDHSPINYVRAFMP
jgi:hypothetical protein